ncbi:MAG: Asp-tRNA(Asn)/Glu-tRNA(Gln) amidotransferase subunit GatC [Tenericutes bacterium]|nr:Asp-tRNA(Asn)/Glu-tRNA(Gln) amidotransferase subunit GatC [Mycoplasmatota bacterium]MDD7630389.1 Asp-tRNA(Asn)/Glu-tRNA(Gln) amidotransferase subunit GatC [bacterium]MDO4377292.1 Asp-tRNA(Asn)/Glu-tRNA(Gln) amidotransferase subunit GatC [bacterium]MDY4109035.1 Asp-tRNA(Asn)/Glu-tRNA(Gln) amidotransferase subunit GatC [Bacilli bacterium]
MTNEEVLKVAHLARVSIDDNEIEMYKGQLEAIMNEINKINEVEIIDDDIMISPSSNINKYREDVPKKAKDDVLSNAPKTNGNYIQIKRFVNE